MCNSSYNIQLAARAVSFAQYEHWRIECSREAALANKNTPDQRIWMHEACHAVSSSLFPGEHWSFSLTRISLSRSYF